MPTVYQYTTENLAIGDVYGGHDPNRYYLHEYFEKVPALNADIESITGVDNPASAAVITFTNGYNKANKSFEIIITNASVCTFNTTSGISLTTDGALNDSVIVLPHLDAGQTAWTGINWKTSSQVHWSCAISINNNSNVIFWAGLKLTNVPAYATDADQAYFLYASDDDQGALETNANLHFVYSVGGTDYITDSGIAVAAAATNGNGGIYKLRIVIDNNRQVAVYVNGVQYGLVTTSTAGGATQSTSTTLSSALTNDIDLIPYVGVEALTAAAKQITLCYEKISRVLFE